MIDTRYTYWNNEGEFQAEYDEMLAANFEFTKTSQNIFHRYYRFYNDGDCPNAYKYHQCAYAAILEEKVNDRIAKEWKRFNK